MKNLKYGLLWLGLVLVLGSCSVHHSRKAFRSSDFSPDIVRMNVYLDDFILLGEEEVSIAYSRYFGLFKTMETINGKPFKRREQKVLATYAVQPFDKTWIETDKHLGLALYGIQKQYPEAEMIVPIYKASHTHKMFLGSKITKVMRVKVYKMRK